MTWEDIRVSSDTTKPLQDAHDGVRDALIARGLAMFMGLSEEREVRVDALHGGP